MLSLVLLFSFVGYSFQNCCGPTQWEGMESITIVSSPQGNGAPSITKSSYKVTVDAANLMVSAKGMTTTNGVNTMVDNIRDYKHNVQYTVLDGKCKQEKLAPMETLNCVPANSTRLGSAYFGAGSNNLTFDSYLINSEGYTVTFSVAPGCIPMAETYYGTTPEGANIMGVTSFTGITAGIADTSVFAIPRSCALPSSTSPDSGVLGKRSIMF